MELTWSLFVAVIALAVACQYIAVAFGIGYGTALTPLLIIIGFAPLQIVPAVLLSQLAGGIVGGIAHHRAGNIHLDFRRDDELIKQRLRGLGYLPRSLDAKVVLALVAIGVIGVLVGVFTAVKINQFALEVYIGVLVLLIGIIVLLQRGRRSSFSWKSIFAVGIIGAFNKGMTGGGYVPLVTGGQIIGGREAKSSVGSTTVSIAVLCAVGFLGYLLAEGVDIDWKLAGAACIGAVAVAPFAALTTKKVKTEKLTIAIGLATILLGALTLVKVFILQ
jgi:uncharacterized membrane protein YfcA